MRKNPTIYYKLKQFLIQAKDTVFMRSEFNNLGEPRQITRALNRLQDEGQLVRLGYGVYAKAKKTKWMDKPVLVEGFDKACLEALTKLGIDWELGSALKANLAKQSTQVPARLVVRLKSRYRGELAYEGAKLKIEGNINAR